MLTRGHNINMVHQRLGIMITRSLSTIELQKFVKAAVLGAPNAGKSTLINTLLGRRVCSLVILTITRVRFYFSFY